MPSAFLASRDESDLALRVAMTWESLIQEASIVQQPIFI